MTDRRDNIATVGGDDQTQYYMGIDPGGKGAAVIITNAGFAAFILWPPDNDIRQIFQQLGCCPNIVTAVLEKVSARPGQGVSSSFKFGMNYGIWQGILHSLMIPHQLLTPQQWQKKAGIAKSDSPDPKTRAFMQARRLLPYMQFPKVEWKREAFVDAFLMAHVARKEYLGL